MFSLLAIASLLGLLPTALSHDNGLAKIPQMGWNTWNHYACNINEYGVLTSAQQLVSECLLDLGYEYLVMDDCWSASRNSTGHLQANTTKFPRGIGPLVDEVHGMGLKFGMYSDAGKYTCGGYAGSLDHETIHAETFAAGGVDYLKYGNCFDEGRSGTANISYEGYERMTDALNATGRPILYSLCNWGEDGVWNWGSTIANSWPITVVSTITLPVRNNRCPCQTYDCALPGYHRSILNKAAPVLQKNSAQFGGWADLDMLEGGNRGMGYEEYKTHFSMWAAVKSSLLLLGNDISNMTDETRSIIIFRRSLRLSRILLERQRRGWSS
ncbi:hypothetical protein G7K_5872-t1 [Saitoella complicata NRRL Y-17804]|uniref:Alpha-galactosidase n=1 Tax=Saitoella complicata (strain BCRC 22490 / CBS 7301 / JCM 7358 / NBRC 10748 / NRRL Y-17804) TaxID=698492 RepID=A0A0E9NPL3_SAICN|nr:hypothetical protein G7K_5872-t1 [Saitoella complicata NRRL Y-17804]